MRVFFGLLLSLIYAGNLCAADAIRYIRLPTERGDEVAQLCNFALNSLNKYGRSMVVSPRKGQYLRVDLNDYAIVPGKWDKVIGAEPVDAEKFLATVFFGSTAYYDVLGVATHDGFRFLAFDANKPYQRQTWWPFGAVNPAKSKVVDDTEVVFRDNQGDSAIWTATHVGIDGDAKKSKEHQVIAVLPNGLFAWGVTNDGILLHTNVDPKLATKDSKPILNPISCICCHTSGIENFKHNDPTQKPPFESDQQAYLKAVRAATGGMEPKRIAELLSGLQRKVD